jgi:hypothetical protein
MMKLPDKINSISFHQKALNHIGGVMVQYIMGSSRVKPDYKTGIYCFFAKHAAFRSKSKYWLTRNQINVSDWSDIFTSGV